MTNLRVHAGLLKKMLLFLQKDASRYNFVEHGYDCINFYCVLHSQEKGRPLPKFGEWDVNDPASAESFTVIFNKARDEKKTGGKPESPTKASAAPKHEVDAVKPQGVCYIFQILALKTVFMNILPLAICSDINCNIQDLLGQRE